MSIVSMISDQRILIFLFCSSVKQFQGYQYLTRNDLHWPLMMFKFDYPHNIAHHNYLRNLLFLIFHLSTNFEQFQWYRKMTHNDLNWPLITTKNNTLRDMWQITYHNRSLRVLLLHLSTNLKQFHCYSNLTSFDLHWP